MIVNFDMDHSVEDTKVDAEGKEKKKRKATQTIVITSLV